MSLANIRTEMATALKTITGIDSDHVFTNEPNVSIVQEQCPCIVLPFPRITPSVPYNQAVQAIYHFEIKYLYAPVELAQSTKANNSIGNYLASIWDALFAEFMLSNTAMGQDFGGDIPGATVEYGGKLFWGINIPWNVVEQVSATFTP